MLDIIRSQVSRVPFLRRVRRNHALEHATIHVLVQRRRPHKRLMVAGRSTDRGFFVYGAVDTAELHTAVNEALARLRSGEHTLAVHPNCGTSLLTSAVLTSAATFAVFAGARRLSEQFNRLPMAVFFATAALILSQPLGLSLQRTVTTEADMGDLKVVEVRRLMDAPIMVHWVGTVSS